MTAARPVLVVENDHRQSRILVECLGLHNQFEASVAATLSEADALLTAEEARFDAVILDLGMPDGNGHGYLAKLRQQGHKMPIIAMGPGDEADVVRGLDGGANDYVTRAFRPNELLARMRAQLRTFDNSEDATFTIGQYAFRPAAKLLVDPAKRRHSLTNRETQILKFLYRAGARPVPRLVLLEGVWGYNSNSAAHNLATHIYQIRRKIEANPANCRALPS